MIEINKLRKLYQLKNVERVGRVKERQESPAEHSWSSLILADYVINNFKIDIDRLKVFELLMYHDVVEIEAGDVAIHHEKERENKREEEEKAFQILKKDFPLALKDKFEQLFKFNRGFYDRAELPVPKKDYGYDPGLMSNKKFAERLRKDLKEKEMLEDFDPIDRDKNAAGGLINILKL